MSTPLIEAVGVRKQFPGVLALDGVNCRVNRGEVLAIVGENGAGKSTLMKVLAGVYQPDGGEVRLNGEPVKFPTPQAAMRAGVSLIHQELNLAENLSVLDNLFLGREPTVGGPLRLLDRRGTIAAGRRLLERVGLPPDDLSRTVGELAPGQKQLVEIARALGLDAKLLIMDEPTSSLTQKETDRLYAVIDDLKAGGVSVMYISHRLAEIKRCCDRAVVLRDGKNAGELTKAEITHDNLVRLMVGRDLKSFFPRTRPPVPADTPPLLELSGLTYRNGPPHTVSLAVRPGEVLGMAGLVGAGRTELSEAVFGLRPVTGGSITLEGKPLRIRRPGDAVRAGVLLVPEDRRAHGLVLEQSVGFNLSLPNLGRLSTGLLIRPRDEAKLHAEGIASLRVKTPSARQAVGLLSGGNQQKVVFGKWLARGPKVLILDEPTRGVDVGAKTEIYALIDDLAARGVAVWMITSDMEELLGVSDRVVVMHEGRLAGELARSQLNEEAVMRLATGAS
ncbi:MAG: sugar ABC transporter ATP-binding protein [Fimbriiglobus sp.]|jgi:ribose transport system ATP-binding protein|nr:sugar ABC transporter ATP-binding protein [Fimbriiglobus sp.]